MSSAGELPPPEKASKKGCCCSWDQCRAIQESFPCLDPRKGFAEIQLSLDDITATSNTIYHQRKRAYLNVLIRHLNMDVAEHLPPKNVMPTINVDSPLTRTPELEKWFSKPLYFYVAKHHYPKPLLIKNQRWCMPIKDPKLAQECGIFHQSDKFGISNVLG